MNRKYNNKFFYESEVFRPLYQLKISMSVVNFFLRVVKVGLPPWSPMISGNLTFILLFFFFMLPFCCDALLYTKTGVKIDAKNLLYKDYTRTLKLLKNFDNICFRILAKREEKNFKRDNSLYSCIISFTRRKHSLRKFIKFIPYKRKVFIYLPQNFESWNANYSMLSKIVKILCMRQLNIFPSRKNIKEVVPEWIAAGIISMAKRNIQKLSVAAPDFYPFAYALMNHGYIPDINTLILHPPPSGEIIGFSPFSPEKNKKEYFVTPEGKNILKRNYPYILYSFYGEFCEIALKAALTDRNVKFSLIAELDKNTPFLSCSINNNIYKKYFRKCTVNIFTPFGSQGAKLAFEKLLESEIECTFCQFGKNNKKRKKLAKIKRMIKLKDIPKCWKTVQNKKAVIFAVKQKLIFLKFQLPIIFYPVMDKIISAFDILLSENSEKKFTKNFRAAVHLFYATIEEQKKTEIYIEQKEKEFVAPITFHAPELQEIPILDFEVF